MTKNKVNIELVNNEPGAISEDFEELYFKFHGRLVLYANKFVHDMDLAKDVVQEVFIAFWKQKEKRVVIQHAKTYLFQVTRNKALNHIRANTREVFSDTEISEVLNSIERQIVSSTDTPFNSLLEVELENQFKNVKNKLPKGCLEVFEMSRNEGLKNSEIAEKLGISIKAVEKQVTKALMIFRRELLPYISLVLFF